MLGQNHVPTSMFEVVSFHYSIITHGLLDHPHHGVLFRANVCDNLIVATGMVTNHLHSCSFYLSDLSVASFAGAAYLLLRTFEVLTDSSE